MLIGFFNFSAFPGSAKTWLGSFPLLRNTSKLGWDGFRFSGKHQNLVGAVSNWAESILTSLGGFSPNKSDALIHFYCTRIISSSITQHQTSIPKYFSINLPRF